MFLHRCVGSFVFVFRRLDRIEPDTERGQTTAMLRKRKKTSKSEDGSIVRYLALGSQGKVLKIRPRLSYVCNEIVVQTV